MATSLEMYGDLDFKRQQALRLCLENLAGDPAIFSAADTGRLWFNTAEEVVKFYDGTQVITLGTGTGSASYIKVRCATNGPIAIAGVLVSGLDVNSNMDGASLQVGDLVLVKDQDGSIYGSGPSDNGVYIVVATQNTPTRYELMNAPSEFNAAMVIVQEGTVNADTVWICTAVDPVVGTDAAPFVQVVTPTNIVADSVLTGNGTPLGVVIAEFTGQVYVDSQISQVFIAVYSGDEWAWYPISFDATQASPVNTSATLTRSLYALSAQARTFAPATSLALTITEPNDYLRLHANFVFKTGANNATLSIANTHGLTLQWENNSTPPPVAATANANETYLIGLTIDRDAGYFFGRWKPIDHTTGLGATTTQQGIVELATQAEAEARTDTARAVTPASLINFVTAVGVADNVFYIEAGQGDSVTIPANYSPGYYLYVNSDSGAECLEFEFGSGFNVLSYGHKANASLAQDNTSVNMSNLVGNAWTFYGSSSNPTTTLTITGNTYSVDGVSFIYNTHTFNSKLILAAAGKTFAWANSTPPFAVGGSSLANQQYLVRLHSNHADSSVIYAEWAALGHTTGVVTPTSLATSLEGYQKTAYRTVTASASGTILGSATGITNKYVHLTAYADGTPNTPIGIEYTVASNGDIAWSTDTAFDGYIVISGSVSPVSV
jgi:hypothetical protein